VVFPRLVAVPLGLIAGWIGLALLVRAWRLRGQREAEDERPAEGVHDRTSTSPERR
jgi:hypothetical protein